MALQNEKVMFLFDATKHHQYIEKTLNKGTRLRRVMLEPVQGLVLGESHRRHGSAQSSLDRVGRWIHENMACVIVGKRRLTRLRPSIRRCFLLGHGIVARLVPTYSLRGARLTATPIDPVRPIAANQFDGVDTWLDTRLGSRHELVAPFLCPKCTVFLLLLQQQQQEAWPNTLGLNRVSLSRSRSRSTQSARPSRHTREAYVSSWSGRGPRTGRPLAFVRPRDFCRPLGSMPKTWLPLKK